MTADDRSRYVLGADVGGTFTDITVFDRETRSLTTEKVLSTPEDPSSGVLDGVTAAMEMVDAELSQLQAVNHGTTIVTNMLLEETGAKTGLVVTEGYEHVLHLARAWTPGPLYGWIDFEKPDPLADLAATKGISARLDDDGEVLDPVDEADVIDAVDELLDQGVEAIAVMLLNSYVDGKQEERIREIVAEAYPDLPVSISSAGVAEYGEYERTMTAVINAYSRPQVGAYLDGLKASLQEQGWQGRLNVVRSDGGTTSVGMAKRSPVSLVLSGPSGGVVGAAHLANTLGVPDVLTLDM
jgi:N-methylhydantoinase A